MNDDLNRQAIADAFNERLEALGRSKKRVADDAGLSTRSLDRITSKDPTVSIKVLNAVSAAMWGDNHYDALVRAGRGQPPVEEEPDLADRIGRVEAVQARLADNVGQLTDDFGRLAGHVGHLAAGVSQIRQLLEQLVRDPRLNQDRPQLEEEDA